jgi:hypothetical protein
MSDHDEEALHEALAVCIAKLRQAGGLRCDGYTHGARQEAMMAAAGHGDRPMPVAEIRYRAFAGLLFPELATRAAATSG